LKKYPATNPISNRQQLELRRDRAWLALLRAECALRRGRLVEDRQTAKARGDLAAYRALRVEWRKHPRIYGASPPRV
jgi:hypothetical protein